MIVISLQSGSNGNCIYIETQSTRLLIDAGISARQATTRLAATGRDIRAVDALLVTHDHSDHTRSMGTYHRKFDIPVVVTQKTLAAICSRSKQGRLSNIQPFVSGESFQMGELAVESIRTPHDSVDGVAFVLDDGVSRIGIFTDLGHIFTGLSEALATLDAVVIESNYDPKMLEDGLYPEHLKQRIRGPRGHLSNEESADLLSQVDKGRLQWACLAHLSEKNNCPEIALNTHRQLLGDQFPLYVASRYQQSECMKVESATV